MDSQELNYNELLETYGGGVIGDCLNALQQIYHGASDAMYEEQNRNLSNMYSGGAFYG